MVRPRRARGVLLGLSPLLPCLLACFLSSGCFVLRPSEGGGQTKFTGDRRPDPAGIALPAGYRIETTATGLTFPTGVVFDDAGRTYVVEAGYCYGEVFTTPRLLRVDD